MIGQDTEVIDHRNLEECGGFEYYELNGQPLRVVLNEDQLQMGGDRLNAETGELYRDATVLGDVFKEEDCDPIDESRFYELCAERIAEKKSDLDAADDYVDDYGGSDFEL